MAKRSAAVSDVAPALHDDLEEMHGDAHLRAVAVLALEPKRVVGDPPVPAAPTGQFTAPE